MHAPFFRIQSTPDLPSLPASRMVKTSDAIIERISSAYTRENAHNTGTFYWPDPLPTPDMVQPDPLLLFQPGKKTISSSYTTLVPLTPQEVIARRQHMVRPSMQIPLGLIDKPASQQRDTLIIDLHGPRELPSTGPLLILGSENSGKNTALQTSLFWLITRYYSTQLKCLIIDPTHELTMFRKLGHIHDSTGSNLWTAGSTDEEIQRIANRLVGWINERYDQYGRQPWDDDTLDQYWQKGDPLPQYVLIINQYHLFADRPQAAQTLSRLISIVADLRAMGFYLILTSTKAGPRHFPPEILQKITTRISLFLQPHARPELLGRAYPMDPIPGRGLLLAPDYQLHQIQTALPIHGQTELERQENLIEAIKHI